MPRLMLLDSNGLIYRGYHALPPLTTSKGELVNAVFGFCSILLRGIQDVVVGTDFSKGLNLSARLDCRTQDDARHVHDALRGAIGMARLSTPDNHPELLQVYDAIQVSQGNSRVEVSGDLPADQVDHVLSLWLKKPL